MKYFVDRKFELPRIWSNDELKKVAHLFTGDVLNASAWKDDDKQGVKYKDYFRNARSYTMSNFKSEVRGYQGSENEFFLDLSKELDQDLIGKFDIVFNHTTLEHIYEVKKAFKNLCLLSKDIVIIVVPFLQQMHSDYGDYWRFSPLGIKKLFEENGLSLQYLSFNNHKNTSVYVFAIASKSPEKWEGRIDNSFSIGCKNVFLDTCESYVGCRSISNSLIFKLKKKFINVLVNLRKKKRC